LLSNSACTATLRPHFNAETSDATHVISLVMMVNEKFREGVEPWTAFHASHAGEPDKFASFFKRVMVGLHSC
jgi:intron-binding protein aquarius